jgi:hypothetical protein
MSDDLLIGGNPATQTPASQTTVSVQTGALMSNIGNFIKKNAVLLGIGAIGLAAGIYFLTRKNKKSKGLSGISRRKRSSKKRAKRSNSKTLKAKKLS